MINKLKKGFQFLIDKNYRIVKLAKAGYYNKMPDEKYLKMVFKARMGIELNLDNPKGFNQKLQWLKLNNRNPLYTMLVDKYVVRDYIAAVLGDEYLIPILGVWNDPDEIDFDSLPNQFVLKCNHNSGTGMCICTDKSRLHIESVKKELRKGLSENFFLKAREWPYKDVPRRIICEKYMRNNKSSDELTDYKFFCVNGKVDNVMVCLERDTGSPKFYFFNQKWELLRLNNQGLNAPDGFTIPKPKCINEMFDIASKLSEGFPFVRVDLYEVDGKIYFGEFTFFPDGGWDKELLTETDAYFGSLIDLPISQLTK